MPVTRPNADKFAAVLQDATPAVAKFVIHEIEINRRRGHDEPIFEVALDAVRGIIRQSGEKIERVQTPKRLFCSLFEEFLVERSLDEHQRGRIDRASIGPIWDWLVSGWGPRDLSGILEKLDVEFRREDHDGVARLMTEFRSEANAAIRAGLMRVQGDPVEQKRLAVRLGGTRVLKDAVQLQRILTATPSLIHIRESVDYATRIENEDDVDRLVALLKKGLADNPKSPELPIGIIMARLFNPIDIVRIGVKARGMRVAGQILSSVYAPALNLVAYDMELLGLEILEAMQRRKGVAAIIYWLSRLHEDAEQLQELIEFSFKSEFGARLVGIRNRVSIELDREIAAVPLKLKELYRRRPDFGKAATLRGPDEVSLFEAMQGLVLMIGCRPYLDQLSLNRTISATEIEVRRYLRIVSEALVNDVRNHHGAARESALAWFDTAVQLTRIALGEEDARLLARSGEVAARAGAA